jgi:hypothetical protein
MAFIVAASIAAAASMAGASATVRPIFYSSGGLA